MLKKFKMLSILVTIKSYEGKLCGLCVI